jgi:glutaredoxin
MAKWCPHCVPVSTDPAPELARRIGVPLRILDIDQREEELAADELVRDHGDWTEDYLIPQLFLTFSDGRVEHLLTGVPGPTEGTRALWTALLRRWPPSTLPGAA